MHVHLNSVLEASQRRYYCVGQRRDLQQEAGMVIAVRQPRDLLKEAGMVIAVRQRRDLLKKAGMVRAVVDEIK